MELAGAKRSGSMHPHQDDPGGDGHEKWPTAVNGTREHRADQNDEHRIEGRLLGERAPVPEPNQRQAHDEDEETAKGNMKQGELIGFPIRAEKEKEKILKHVVEQVWDAPAERRVSK
jgi:hypothetical protein